ncbi:MAG: K+/H+ antiporter subunit F [Steroidobacteraceae bacterium]|nr:K+/H+ antiporter subunit F [Steroidobacteraceae bacterium]
MLTVALDVASVLLAGALLLAGWRLLRGPDPLDRALALDTLYVNATALLVLYGVRLGTGHFYEAALIVAILGFLGTAAIAKYLLRGDVAE